MQGLARAVFRFDVENHEYIDLATGAVLPHITGMLERTGWIDDTWYTEESCERGQMVHRLTAEYDLGALDVASCVSRYKGWLLGHVKAVSILRPEMLSVEEPIVHPVEKFGGRPDRICVVAGLRGVWEIKSGAPARSHQIQTALQAVLAAAAGDVELPPALLTRLCCYVKDSGKFKVEEHTDKRDFDEARRIIRECCRR